MNKVEFFWKETMSEIAVAINEFAEDYEIINVSVVTDTTIKGTYCYKALVLYKD
ncbi:hypothetical protein SEQ01_18210 [Streptococcus equinus]|uniref:hypothetical protein n=1 Tax=Streptococcus equinus TaxID=1335 RepID=UPI001166AD8E|nr:hypothetical protein [Streptococcus equinus]GEB11630.1 hypothetical protein SEQ01_18210 [Streptococcus equinus]